MTFSPPLRSYPLLILQKSAQGFEGFSLVAPSPIDIREVADSIGPEVKQVDAFFAEVSSTARFGIQVHGMHLVSCIAGAEIRVIAPNTPVGEDGTVHVLAFIEDFWFFGTWTKSQELPYFDLPLEAVHEALGGLESSKHRAVRSGLDTVRKAATLRADIGVLYESPWVSRRLFGLSQAAASVA